MNTAKNQPFEFAVTLGDSFMTAMKGLTMMEEMDYVEDCPLLECAAPSQGRAVPAVNVG